MHPVPMILQVLIITERAVSQTNGGMGPMNLDSVLAITETNIMEVVRLVLQSTTMGFVAPYDPSNASIPEKN